jgi:hypothetical protein
VEEQNERAAKPVVLCVLVKELCSMGDCRANLCALPRGWPYVDVYSSSEMKQLKDAAIVVAVPYDRLACMS